MREKINVIWDMETGDPDDFLTLILLLGHPAVNLRAVTVTPGTTEQVGLVRRAVRGWFGREDVRIGAFNLDHDKQCVSGWHTKAFGPIEPSRDAEPGGQVLLECCDAATTLITGAPLKNLGAAMTLAEETGQPLVLGRWVAQGGFAGEGVVPAEQQLDKFRGMRTCPSYNMNGDPRSALRAIDHPGIMERRFVSKNVCHGVTYDAALHARVTAVKDTSRSLEIIWRGMSRYLNDRPSGKLFHDPLAACCAINMEIGQWAQVRIFRERGEWGSELEEGSKTLIITGYDHDLFIETLLQTT